MKENPNNPIHPMETNHREDAAAAQTCGGSCNEQHTCGDDGECSHHHGCESKSKDASRACHTQESGSCACHHHVHREPDASEEPESVDEWFRQKNPRVAFLELKENVANQPKELIGVPLPIRIPDFLNGVEANFSEEIPVQALLNGMIWMLAIDPTFRYNENYRNFLDRATKDPVGYAIQLGMESYEQAYELEKRRSKRSDTVLQEESVEETDPDVDQQINEALESALLSFRGAYVLNPHESFAAVQYARLLWQVKKTSLFLEEASHVLEHVLAHDENHPLANAALGDLNAQMGQYLKASAYYQRAVANSYDEAVLSELREAMNAIAPEAAIENATYYLRRADYDHAIEALMKAKAESNRYDIDYYLGVAYQNTGNFEAAVEAFQSAMDRGGNFGDLYNGLVYSLNALGRVPDAIRAATEGLQEDPEDLRLLFNRAVLYETQGEIHQALEDVSKILEYDSISDELLNEVLRLREQLEKEL